MPTDDATPTLRRTQLVTPGSDRSMAAKAAGSDADEVILDLEDSVAPDEKPGARETVVAAALEEDWDGPALSVRVNGLDTGWWYEDVIAIVEGAGTAIETLVVPKIGSAADVHAVETLLRTVEANAGLAEGAVGLQVQIEDGAGMHHAHAIAHASDRVASLIFGPGDYAAAMGAPGLDIGQVPDYPGHYWHFALSAINAAAKSAGVDCIDGPYADFGDEAGFRESAERANLLGCDGKWVIHPAQIAAGNEIFAPDPAVAERAHRIVSAYADAQAAGRGAVEVDGQMVDEATHAMARRVLAKAEAAGVI